MNITFRNRIIFLASVLPFAMNALLHAQKRDSVFALSVDVSPGITGNLESGKITQINFAPALRLLWKPNHLLNIGLESGFLKLARESKDNITSEFGTTNFKAALNAIPILLIFNMKVLRIDFYGGIGTSYLTSKVDAFNAKVIAHVWRYTYYFGAGYTYSFKRIGIGVEARLYTFAKLEKTMIGVMPKLTYDFYKW